MNPSIEYIYDYKTGKGWNEGSGTIEEQYQLFSNNSYVADSHAIGEISLTATENGIIAIGFKTTTNNDANCKLTGKVDGEIVLDGNSGNNYIYKEISAIQGQKIEIDMDFHNINGSNNAGNVIVEGKCSYITTSEDCLVRYLTGCEEGTGAIGGWEKTEMRTYIKETIKPCIPEFVRSRIKIINKTQSAYDTNRKKFTQTTQDDVWLPSHEEIKNGKYKTLFPDDTSRIKKKIDATSGYDWWLRDTFDAGGFYVVRNNGFPDAVGMSYGNNGVVLCFCT